MPFFCPVFPMSHIHRSLVAGVFGVVFGVSAFATARAQEVAPPDTSRKPVAPVVDSSLAMADPWMPRGRPAWHAMVTDLPGDWAAVPATVMQPSGLKTIAGLGVLTAALLRSDGRSYRATKDFLRRNPFAQRTCDAAVYAGDGRVHFAVAAAFGIAGFVMDDDRALRTASQTVEALLVTGMTVQVMKRMTGRESPQAAIRGGGSWHWFPSVLEYGHHQARYYAFPSGHIATTMSTVTVIAANYPEAPWIRPLGFGIAGLLGASLVGVNYHWYSDLPLGIALGYTFGSIVSCHDGHDSGATGGPFGNALSIVPVTGPAGTGIALAMAL